MGAAIQITRGTEGITLAGKFDLINVGMACKTLFVSSAYFRNAKASDNVARIKRAAVSPRKIPSLGAHRGRKEGAESGSSIYNAFMTLSDGDNMQRCSGHIMGFK